MAADSARSRVRGSPAAAPPLTDSVLGMMKILVKESCGKEQGPSENCNVCVATCRRNREVQPGYERKS